MIDWNFKGQTFLDHTADMNRVAFLSLFETSLERIGQALDLARQRRPLALIKATVVSPFDSLPLPRPYLSTVGEWQKALDKGAHAGHLLLHGMQELYGTHKIIDFCIETKSRTISAMENYERHVETWN